MKRPARFFFTAGKWIFPAGNSAEKSGLSVDGRTPDPVLFAADEPDNIVLDSDTVQEIVLKLQGMNIGETAPTALPMAFQFFRDATLKLEDGQYYTPFRVIGAGTELMCITHKDMVIIRPVVRVAFYQLL